MEILTIINILITLANIGILALVIKLYTEYFKNKSITSRKPAEPTAKAEPICICKLVPDDRQALGMIQKCPVHFPHL